MRYSKHIRYQDFQPRSSVPRIVVILCFAPADVFKFVPFLSQLFLIVQLVVTTKQVDPTPSNVRPDKLVLDTEVNEDTATGHKTRCNSDDNE